MTIKEEFREFLNESKISSTEFNGIMVKYNKDKDIDLSSYDNKALYEISNIVYSAIVGKTLPISKSNAEILKMVSSAIEKASKQRY